MASVTELVPVVGAVAACEAVGMPRASFYRQTERAIGAVVDLLPPSLRHEGAAGERSEQIVTRRRSEDPVGEPRVHPRALSPAEQQAVRDVLHSERFQDAAPATVYATLLDEGTYLASERTMYRLLAAEDETRPRRDQLIHPTYTKPELLATAPNQVWSWDITKLLGPAKWTYFHLYVILDVYSRYAVGWMVAHREHADLAERLIAETIAKQEVTPGPLTLHADRGASMTSKPVAFLLADLGVTKTHSRPHVSNDNPYSEAQFKTLKYRPGFPDRFASIEEARAFCQGFFRWYNAEHRHSGIGLLAPEVVHYGQAQDAYDARSQVLATAYAAHPERFVRQAPRPPQLPTAAWINPPQPTSDVPTAAEETRQ
jgi:putative transposase